MNRWPSGRVSASAYYGCWIDLQWWRSQCALLMRPNNVELAVQCSVCRCGPYFLVMVISNIIYQFLHPKLYIYIIQSSWTGVGNNSDRGIKSFNYEHLNFPGKELNVTDITEHQELKEWLLCDISYNPLLPTLTLLSCVYSDCDWIWRNPVIDSYHYP